MLNFLTQPILNFLIFLYQNLGQNLGLAIITLTLIIRGALVPITLPSLRSAKKLQDLKPHLDRLKKKHKDPKKFQQAQLALYQKHGVNPLGGCLPQIAQLIVLIALYQVFIRFINDGQLNGQALHTSFLWLDLSHPDPYYILPLLAGFTQLIFSFMMSSGFEQHADATKNKKKQEQQENNLEMAATMQQQMLFLAPAMTTIIALRFPSGLALYWVATTVFSLVQQYFVSGLGGLTTIKPRLLSLIHK